MVFWVWSFIVRIKIHPLVALTVSNSELRLQKKIQQSQRSPPPLLFPSVVNEEMIKKQQWSQMWQWMPTDLSLSQSINQSLNYSVFSASKPSSGALYIAACRPVTRQRPRNKLLYNNRFQVKAPPTDTNSTRRRQQFHWKRDGVFYGVHAEML
jgi:hypothetical protein